MKRTCYAGLGIALLSGAQLATGAATAASFAAQGAAGVYRVELESPDLLRLNTLESWVVTVTDAVGQPVVDATIAVSGGMPAHGHGLPTAPAVSVELGGGRYQLDGVKFNMTGLWVLQIDITAAAGTDTASFELDVQP
jgi:hypothetical protein